MDPMMMSGMYGFGMNNPFYSTMNNDIMMAPFLNQYQEQVSLLDNYSALNSDMMGMNGSIFPSFTGNYGMTDTFDYDKYYKNIQKNQDYMYENAIRQTEKNRSNELKANAPMEDIKKKVEILHDKIIQNEQEQIQDALASLKASVKLAYDPNGTASDEEILTRAQSMYQMYSGKDLIEDIRNHADGSFKQGFLQAATFGIYDGVTAEENVSKITGQSVGRKEKSKKMAGNAVGGATTGAVALAILSKIKWVGVLFKSKPLIAAGIGAIAGAIAAPFLSQSKS